MLPPVDASLYKMEYSIGAPRGLVLGNGKKAANWGSRPPWTSSLPIWAYFASGEDIKSWRVCLIYKVAAGFYWTEMAQKGPIQGQTTVLKEKRKR